jgi:hypothetical protein
VAGRVETPVEDPSSPKGCEQGLGPGPGDVRQRPTQPAMRQTDRQRSCAA